MNPEEITAIQKEAQDKKKKKKMALQNKEKKLNKLEMSAETIREKMRDFQHKSTMIKNNDDYRAAMHQIETCKKQISDLEDQELDTMEAIEAARADYQEAKKDLGTAESRVKDMLSDLDTRVKNCETQIGTLKSERSTIAKDIEPDVLRKYERIRKSRKNQGAPCDVLVPIRETVCERCHMNVTAQNRMDARKGEKVSCGNCGALLYWED